METNDFFIVPKLIGLVVESRSGHIKGVVDASEILTDEVRQELAEQMGEAIGRSQLEIERSRLEGLYLLPARDVENERNRGD